jgi:hypothetical protein
MSRFDIPKQWSTNEALLVMDFLEQIHSAIWDLYEEMAVDALARQATSPSAPPSLPHDEEDIPF